MSDRTKIAWCDSTWNPVIGCSHISPGCTNCYAEKMACRLAAMHSEMYEYATDADGWSGRIAVADESTWDKPRHWRKPRRIFVCSMGDLFHDAVMWGNWHNVIGVAADCLQHTFLILTKRAEHMRELAIVHTPTSNMWLGTTCEDQQRATERIPYLLATPAAHRYLSLEPLLGPIDLTVHIPDRINLVIVGCESGPHRRDCKEEWVRDIKDQCADAGVPFFNKQMSIRGKVVHDMALFPEDLRVRQWPEVIRT